MLNRTTSFIISLHLLFVVMLLFTQNTPLAPRLRHAKVHEVRIVSTPTSPPKPKPSAVASSKPTPKPQPRPTPTKKIPQKPQTAATPTPTPSIPWKEIDQALAKIEAKEHTQREPPMLNLPQVDDFETLLVTFLHEALHLPEIGEVKIELQIKADGSVAHLVVLHSESEKNKRYLQTELPKLFLPMPSEHNKTWTLTFSNEI